MKDTSMEEAISRLDELAGRHIEKLRQLTKRIQDSRIARDNEMIKLAITDYDSALEVYIPGADQKACPELCEILQSLIEHMISL